MKPIVFKSFRELARVVAPALKNTLYQPHKPPVASYRLVDATGELVYETQYKDDPTLLSKMQNFRLRNKPHRVCVLHH
jgi:hypothetical protein